MLNTWLEEEFFIAKNVLFIDKTFYNYNASAYEFHK